MNAAIVGATGYGSAELIRILSNHPYVTLTTLISSSKAGAELREAFPHLSHLNYSLEEGDPESLADKADIVFFAAPSGVSSQWVPSLVEQGRICIDLAADFRLDGSTYRKWYKGEPPSDFWLSQSAYGLSEWFAPSIRKANVIANPGCYPTAALMVLIPLLKQGILDGDSVVIDGKSGMSGAGRSVKQQSLFCEINENLFPYQVGKHRHTPEMERYAGIAGGQRTTVLFTPQIVPMNRGLLVTVYGPVAKGWTLPQVREVLLEAYEESPFVRVVGEDQVPRTKGVQGSNFCDVGVYLDERSKTVVGMAAIDNLVKGAAGQAVQNLNLRMGWPETAGLQAFPQYP